MNNLYILFMDISHIKNRVIQSFERTFNQAPGECLELQGDGSDRKIFRLWGDQTIIGVYGENVAENEAFLSFTRHFLSHDLPVPRIYGADEDVHIYFLEDLGDRNLCDWIKTHPEQRDIKVMYENVLAHLLRFQKIGQTIDYSKCYQFETFDTAAMYYDLDYFRTAFLNRFAQKDYDDIKLQQDFDRLILHISQERPVYFLYRDFQSKNIMIQNGQPRFLDYQSGRRGALQYDVASLLFDGNVDLAQDFRLELLEFYADQASRSFNINKHSFNKTFNEFALLRLLQILAAFSFLYFVKQKPAFLATIPQALKNVNALLTETDVFSHFPELRSIFENDIFKESLISEREQPCVP